MQQDITGYDKSLGKTGSMTSIYLRKKIAVNFLPHLMKNCNEIYVQNLLHRHSTKIFEYRQSLLVIHCVKWNSHTVSSLKQGLPVLF